MSDYIINRQEAAKLIWVSLRSIDRYTLSWKLNYKKIWWRVLFKQDDLLNIKTEQNTNIIDNNIDINFSRYKNKDTKKQIEVFNNQNIFDQYDKDKNIDIKLFIKTETERDVYKKLYSSLLIELQNKQKELENINFKLWDIISKQNIPLLENKKNEELINSLKNELSQKYVFIKNLKNELYFQRNIKNLLISLIFLSITILSFWYFYIFKI